MPPTYIRERRVSWKRLLAGGIVLTSLAGLAGGALELHSFGPTDDAAAARVNAYVEQQFERMVRATADVSSRIVAAPTTLPALAGGRDQARLLFDLVEETRHLSTAPGDIAITVYDGGLLARAWTGAPSDLPDERIAGPATLFVTPSPLGLRLVHLQPISTPDDRRLGSVASEHVLSRAPAFPSIGPTDYVIETPLAPVSLRTRIEGAGDHARPGAVLLRAPSGETLAEAWADPADLRRARVEWRRSVAGTMVTLIGLTVLLLAGPLLDRRGTARTRTHLRATGGALALTAAGGLLLALAYTVTYGRVPSGPVALLLGGAIAAALVGLLAESVARLRPATRSRPVFRATEALRMALTQAGAGLALAVLVVGFQRLLATTVDPVTVDLRQFSLHPWNASRLLLLAGIVAAHLAVLWAGTLLLVAASTPWRIPRRAIQTRLGVLALWILPSAIAATAAAIAGWPVPAHALALSALACGVAALVGQQLAAWYRRTTHAARIFALFLAFLIPTLLLYPSMDFFAERAVRQLIETQYAVQALNRVQTILDRLEEARAEVDALEELPALVEAAAATSNGISIDAAFLVWRQTALARERLTSAVELYDETGKLVSRFALNVPEYSTVTVQPATGCGWDVFGEVASFGAEERRMLHAERRLCVPGEDGGRVRLGGIILHVLYEYETLPFISSQNPYLEAFRTADSFQEGTPGGDVEVAIYGWGLQPLYTSGRSAWPLSDDLFQRLYTSREPFWATIANGPGRHEVYFSNDRLGIFAIGYRVPTVFDRFVHLAELTTFGAIAFVLVLVGTSLFTRVARERPRVGRALLREIRASFYRKLFLAFVFAAIIPVLALALVIRAYVETLLRADIEAEAARTAAIAQRVIEELNLQLRRTPEAFGTFTDDFMVWISQVIDQDVNVFDGPRLVATSERNLFASGVLPTRTPDRIYRTIVLDRAPSIVVPDTIGEFSYMLAGAPIRAVGEEALVTVPLTLRQQEIEREIDELDRGVHLAALFFVLLGAGIGLSMAERIADPVRRLTRATGRIARGDFDARIAVKSSDELRRLVDAFNSMAAELKAQRTQLERTHRLEAWAEMARQVAHEIKNPLTPIQLSAEHLLRVHADRGEPLGGLLDSCVSSILGQVKLLRQISSEFSNFASSPTARPGTVLLQELVAEVINPYRTGLQDRIEIVASIPADLPPVHVDRALVARAFSNIVENALYAMPGTGRLAIAAIARPDTVQLTVTDTGGGIDEEALARVFEPYFSTKTTGTGLGLPIARRNIELSGGSVDVTSTKGVGTTVTVRLPRVL